LSIKREKKILTFPGYVENKNSKTGKHGHAKANITGIDIFTGAKKVDISPTSHNMTAPFVSVSNWTLIDIADDGFCTLMDEGGNDRADLKLPSEEDPDGIGAKIRAAFEKEDNEVTVVVTKAMDHEVITDFKEASTA